MLRLVGFLAIAVIGGGGMLLVDYNTVRQAVAADDSTADLSFAAYLGELPARITSVTSSISKDGLPGSLVEMMPNAPDGWTVRAATKADLEPFLPKKGAKADPKDRDKVTAVGTAKVARSAEVVVLSYEKGDRRVMIQAVRYPDTVFTSPNAVDRRYDLRMQAAESRGRPFMTVRGLDVTEEFLGDGLRARYFFAAVGAQIQIRLLATKRMKDADLLPFFETLHVQALNASVVDKVDGLGEVPVIVLASALGAADRDIYDADRAARAAAAITLAKAQRAAEASGAVGVAKADGQGQPARPTTGFDADCAKGTGGIKRCSVAGGN